MGIIDGMKPEDFSTATRAESIPTRVDANLAAAPVQAAAGQTIGRNLDEYLTKIGNLGAVGRDESLKHRMPNM